MNKRLFAAALAGVAVTSLAAGCASDSQTSGGGNSVSVLAIVDTSGPGKTYGAQEVAGLQAAVDYYNSKGGIKGKKVSLKVINDNGDASTATTLAVKELSANPNKYTMVYPGSEGTTIAALIPIMAKFKAYSIALDDGHGKCDDVSTCPTEFSLVGNPNLSLVEGARFMKSKGFDNVGILEQQVAFTQSETAPMVKALQANGIKSTVASFPSTAVSVTAQLQELKAAGADAVFAEVLGAPAGYTLKAREQLAWNAPVLFDIAGSSLDISKLASPAQIKNAFQTVPHCANPQIDVPGFAKLNKFAKGIDGSVPCNLSGNGWDSIVLLKNVVENAKSLSSADLVTSTETLPAKAQSDPDYITYPKHAYSKDNHQNGAQTSSTFSSLPVGTISGTRLKPIG